MGPRQRAYAKELVDTAPDNSVVVLRPKSRTKDQNAKMWAMLADVAKARCEDRDWPPETWKEGFMYYLGQQVRFEPGLDGGAPFPVGARSSKMTVSQMSDLITCIQEYGDRHGVTWRQTERQFGREWRTS